MRRTGNLARKARGGVKRSRRRDITELHDRCGIYTRPEIVKRILDAVGWRAEVDLRQSSLLEPAAGDGAFVAEAAHRLIASFRVRGIEPTAKELARRIRAFELHPREARKAVRRIAALLKSLGLHPQTASACSRHWVTNSDFLVTRGPIKAYTHTVGNPPYVRWTKIPKGLKKRYERSLPDNMATGDLFIPFLDRALEALLPDGQCGFLCSDRWRYMAFAEAFRRKWLPQLAIASEDYLSSAQCFTKVVDSYPSILVAKKNGTTSPLTSGSVNSGKTLRDLQCVVKVGPALGVTAAFVLEPDDDDVESELLRSWIGASDICEGGIQLTGRRVVTMHRADGSLIDLKQYPRLRARLKRHRPALERRWIVRNGAQWYETIDRVRSVDWARPKLLVPELAKVPRLAIDTSGAIPSHGVYAIFSADDDVKSLYDKLRDGKLAQALNGLAPQVKGGYVRCYRRFLSMITLAD